MPEGEEAAAPAKPVEPVPAPAPVKPSQVISVPPTATVVQPEAPRTKDDVFDDRAFMIFAGSVSVLLILGIVILGFWGPNTEMAMGAMTALTFALGGMMKFYHDWGRRNGG